MSASAPGVTAVLWDIDGTLLHAGRVAVGAFLDAVAEVAGTRPDGRGLDLGGRIDPEIAATLLQSIDADIALVPAVLVRLHELATARAADFEHQVVPLAGVLELVTALDSAGVWQTVVTGNIESIGRLKLQAGGLVPLIDVSLGGFGDHGSTRVEVGRRSLDRLVAAGWDGDLSRCWIIGDTPRDLQCARALGVRCALVGTGRHSVESMADLGADILLHGLDQAEELLSRWGLEQ
ncbi:HAD family hydrolase [Nakamurella silvestris]|nr:HAD family hydrolase [Nakamurella silvestris]